MYPYLSPPVGRISFSLNPFTMLKQLIGAELLAKISGMLCVLLCCVMLVAMLPIIFSNFVSTLTMKMFGLD